MTDNNEIISTVPEDTGVAIYKTTSEYMPQGPLRSLAELRADFPNLQILPYMRAKTINLAANGVANIDLDEQAQFVSIQAQVAVLASFEGRAFIPAVGTIEPGSFLVPSGNTFFMYCSGKRQISIREINGATTLASVLYYVTDKLVNV